MGISVFPAAAGGGIKSVQRGSASGSGNVTITAVDIAKSFVTVFGSASSGTVAATGSINAATGNMVMPKLSGTGGGNWANLIDSAENSNKSQSLNVNATNITGGTNNLVAAQVTGFLANSTTLTVSGACRFEVVEFN
jgi:hypothetical protein